MLQRWFDRAVTATTAAKMLETTGMTLRRNLRSAGIYPWPVRGEEPNGDQGEADGVAEPGRERSPAEKGPALTMPHQLVADPLPHVVEDGTKGTVAWRLEHADDGSGPAWLERGDRSEPLFRGWLVDLETAQAYAREHGHDFLTEG